MISPPKLLRNPERLQALHETELLDSEAEIAFDRLTRLACKMLGAPVALVSLVDTDRQFFKSSFGLPEPWASCRETPLSHSFCQYTVESGKPLIVNDARLHPVLSANLAVVDFQVIAYAGIPITLSQGHTIGSFCVVDHQPRTWLPEEIEMLTDLAAAVITEIELRAAHRMIEHQAKAQEREEEYPTADISVYIRDIIKRKRAAEDIQRRNLELQTLSRRLVEVQEAERGQIARELHDEVGQILTGLKLTLNAAKRLPEAERSARLDQAQTLVNELIAHVRNLSLDLRPAMLDDLGLLPALLWQFERYTSQTGIRVNFLQTGLQRRFARTLETAAYRIVQEALTNVARYAGVDEVTVRLTVLSTKLRVEIEDQGKGFESKVNVGCSSGLTGMRERAALLGGSLRIRSTPDTGTQVQAELPTTSSLEETMPDENSNSTGG